MKVIPSEVEGYYDFTVKFRIESVRDYFERSGSQNLPEHQQTAQFGPGWFFEWYSVTEKDKTSLGLYFHVGPRGYPEPITWTIVAKSSDGYKKYLDHTVTEHNFTPANDDWGWSTFMSKSTFDRYAILQQENTLYIRATVKARVATSASLDKCLDVSHEVVTTGNSRCNISFVAKSRRRSSGELYRPRKLFADKSYLNSVCPRLGEYLANSDAAREVVSELFGEGGKRPGLAVPGTTARDRIEEMEDDVDSDFEAEGKRSFPPPPRARRTFRTGSTPSTQTASDLWEVHASLSSGEYPPPPVSVVDDDDKVVPSKSKDTFVHNCTRSEVDVSAQSAVDVNVSGCVIQDDISSLLEDSEWVLEGMVTTDKDTGSHSLGKTEHQKSRSPPSLHWSSSEGVLDMDDAIFSNISTHGVDNSNVKVTRDTASQTDPPKPVTLKPWGSFIHTPPSHVASEIAVTAASVTWEAFLFYLYTGVIVFAPLKSRGEAARKDFIAHYKRKNPHRPAPCSCKSIYRIASMLDMQDLRALALKELGSQLTKDNIVAEIFSQFASRYDEVRELEVGVLKEHWTELKGTVEMSDILKKVVRCNMPHATAIMRTLW